MVKVQTGIAICCALAMSVSAAWADTTRNIKVAAPWEISGPDPAVNGYIFLRMGVMETLVDVADSGALKPGLATEWKANTDGHIWRFRIREASFHDGSPVTPAAVAAVLSRAIYKPGPFGKVPVESVTAEPGTVVIKLSAPFAALPSVLAHSSTVIPAPAAFSKDGKVTKAIGSGPFAVTTLAPPQKLETSRFDSYWGTPATIESATYTAASRAETRALLAESGDADLVFTLDAPGYKRLGAVDNIEAIAVPIPRVMLLKVNAGHAALSSAKTRLALSLAIDRAGIAAGIFRFPDASATQLFPPILAGWHDRSLEAFAYAPERAKSLLSKQGWVPGSDGILTRDGKRFSLTVRTFPDRPELPLVAAALQDQWKAIGVELNVSVASYTEIPAGHKDGSLELALFARNYGLTPDPIGTVQTDFRSGGSDWGTMNWNAAAVADAVVKIAATSDSAIRAPLIKQVASAVQRELPLIPILWYQHTVAVSKRLEGVVVDPLERDYGLDRVRWAK